MPDWQIPFGIDTEPAPTPSDPSRYNVIVSEEGFSSVFRLNADGSGLAAVAGNVSNTTSLDVISFTPIGGFKAEPARSNGQPSGTLPPGTTQATLSLTTDVNATCRYSVQPDVAYGSMPNTFTTTGSTSHSRTITGLASGGSYAFYVRCATAAGQTNSDDYLVSFSVASVTSSAPVAAYGFNEGSGTSAGDASGNGNVGAISGASWTNDGRFGKSPELRRGQRLGHRRVELVPQFHDGDDARGVGLPDRQRQRLVAQYSDQGTDCRRGLQSVCERRHESADRLRRAGEPT